MDATMTRWLLLVVALCCVLVAVSPTQEASKTCLSDGTCVEDETNAATENASESKEKEVNEGNNDAQGDGYDYDEYEEYEYGDDDNEDGEELIDGSCADSNDSCAFWASAGECEKNPKYMLKFCQLSCDSCGYGQEPERMYRNEADRELNEMMRNLERDENGVVQTIDANHKEAIDRVVGEMEEYIAGIRDDPDANPDMKEVLKICKNTHPNCAFWAATGECESNELYMKISCPLLCKRCDQLSVKTRCPLDPNTPNVWEPGSLNEYFTNITTMEEYKKYDPTILSRPEYAEGDTAETADYKIGPWVVTLDNFLSHEEADKLIELGAQEGFHRSADVGKMNADGTFEASINNGRTSTNAWCQHSCYENSTAKTVIGRIANFTNTPETNSEHLQLLRYEVGQFYNNHHDYIDHQRDRQQGSRLMTVFLYLNDVEKGGGTHFPRLNITVQPKKGRALIWPSVLNEAPNDKDWRTEHGALPVEKGVKYGANAWIHQRDFKGPNGRGCQ